MDGVLVVDKPSGPTSHDVVARVRRALRIKRIGHTGTLDPLATGVLPLVIGRATRLASFLLSDRKSYEAGVRLGCATDTYDAAERLAAGLAPPPAPAVSREQVEAVLEGFRGTFSQAPPPYSAKKIAGVAAYRLARRDRAVQPEPVDVTVHELTLEGMSEGLVHLRLTASAGFYVRSLAHELGVRLRCGAHLEYLRRTAAGEFDLGDAVTLDVIEAAGAEAVGWVVPMERLLPRIPEVRMTERGSARVSHGNPIGLGDLAQGTAPIAAGPVRLIDAEGRLMAIGSATPDGLLRPSVVLV